MNADPTARLLLSFAELSKQQAGMANLLIGQQDLTMLSSGGGPLGECRPDRMAPIFEGLRIAGRSE